MKESIGYKKRQPDLLAGLREIAPKGYPWLCVIPGGLAYWQAERGAGPGWFGRGRYACAPALFGISPADRLAIELSSGTIHLQSADGSIIEVPRSEWEVMP